MATEFQRSKQTINLNALVFTLGCCILVFGTSTAQAVCSNPTLFQELSQINIHSNDTRLSENRDLLAECKREEMRRHQAAAQQALADFRSRVNGQDSHDRIHHHDQEAHESSRFVAVDDVFPPQPESMDNVVWPRSRQARISAALTQSSNVSLESLARQSLEVETALGERFVYLGDEPLAMKGNLDNRKHRLSYFSYSNNATVEVLMEDRTVVSLHTIAPDLYQPPLIESEVAEAERIARATLLAEGNTRIAELSGYTILALPTTEESAFFAHRIGYVSFHTHADTRPEYVAWVDLTDQVVVDSRED